LLTTSLSLNKEIIRLAWPVLAQNIARSFAIAILDSYWIGKLGSEPLAAIAVGSFMSWGIYALGEMIPIGTNALVAQSTGAKDKQAERHIATLNLFNSVFLGLIIAAVFIPLLPLLYSFTNMDAPKVVLANQFLYPILIGLSSVILFETSSAIFRGSGNTRTPMQLLLIVFGIKAVLTPLLVFTAGFGIMGASIATVTSYGIGFIIALQILRRHDLIESLRKKFRSIISDTKYNLKVTLESIRIGIPLSLEGLAFSFIYIFVSRYVADFGTVGLASLGIGHRSEAIPYQVGEAFAIVASVLVGQCIGARNPERAERIAWRVLLLSWIPMAVYSLLLATMPDKIAGIFTDDPDIIQTTKVYNLLASVGVFFAMSEAIFAGAFAGAGNSLPPLAIYLPVTILRIPLCALLAPIYGMNGIWIAIFSTSVTKGILIAFWFKLGRWKKRKFELRKEPPEIESMQNPF